MTDDNDAGAAYLASLRQSASQGAAAGPAQAREISQASKQPDGGAALPSLVDSAKADHRKSPRYKCAGSARIQEAGSGVAMWASFADISMHGCYIETPSPLRSGAVLSLKLDADGFRIEATGEVRVIYPGLGMGVSFSKMSDEHRERLRELVRLIAPPSVILSPRLAASAPATRSEASSAVANPAAALQAMLKFFENRHVMGREEFLRILRTSQ